MGKVYIKGVKSGLNDSELEKAIKEVFLKAVGDLSWLKPGETVLLKPAINSPDPYPSTTHPLAIKVVKEILEEKGAKVIVGDQSGIEHVVQDKSGVVRGSSKKCFEQASLEKDLNIDFKAFEQEDWNSGFYRFVSEKTKSWANGFYLTDWINRVDHVINLPRLSTHAQAGVTLGFKNMVGVLRLDSRMDFHANGPLNYFAKANANGSKLASVNDNKNAFFEKIVEISLAVRDKLRLTLFVGTEAQVTIGPDKYGLKFLGKRFVKSYHVMPETGFVFASTDQVAAEVVGIALLTMWHEKIPFTARFWQMLLGSMNHQAKELGAYKVWDSPFVKHALAVGLGKSNVEVDYEGVDERLQGEIDGLLRRETTLNKS